MTSAYFVVSTRIEQKDAAIYMWIQSREEITKLLIKSIARQVLSST